MNDFKDFKIVLEPIYGNYVTEWLILYFSRKEKKFSPKSKMTFFPIIMQSVNKWRHIIETIDLVFRSCQQRLMNHQSIIHGKNGSQTLKLYSLFCAVVALISNCIKTWHALAVLWHVGYILFFSPFYDSRLNFNFYANDWLYMLRYKIYCDSPARYRLTITEKCSE